MTNHDAEARRLPLADLRRRLVDWLTGAAYPLWAEHGIDPATGGFIETLGQNGRALPHARRARVQPRQIYAFAQAPLFGWNGDVRPIVQRGMDYFIRCYRRPDGLFRTLAGTDGAPLDDRALLYDQAFALLGYAAAGQALAKLADFEARAIALRAAIERAFGADGGAFYSGESRDGVFESNPHMHLLEACLAWSEIGQDPAWKVWVQELAGLALRRFIRTDSGALGEAFADDWQPAPGVAGRIVEPGHQFEWAWLLLRAAGGQPGSLRVAALRLIDIGETRGVHHEVAINALLDDLTIHDPNARFWPQTERLKAALFAARLTGQEQYREMAASAAAAILPFLDTPVPGLWLDVQRPSGELIDAPAPASTFYHLVGAIVALETSHAHAHDA